MTSANDMQVGGKHYKPLGATDIQHWDLIELTGLGYLEGYATKYLDRYGKKVGSNPREEVQKARHITQKLLELSSQPASLEWWQKVGWRRKPRGKVPLPLLNEYLRQAFSKTPPELKAAAFIIFTWDSSTDLMRAIAILDKFLENLNQMPVHIDKTGQQHPFGYEGLDEKA
jgi:hypothetical protein